jgi:hemerythrin
MAELTELNWEDKYTVGFQGIDDEHKELFEAVGEVESATARSAQPAETAVLLKKLVSATAKHFASEEAMMREAKYAGFALHVANHQRLMEKVEAFATRHGQNGVAVNQHALKFLRDWLLHHIEGDDARLGAWMQQKR